MNTTAEPLLGSFSKTHKKYQALSFVEARTSWTKENKISEFFTASTLSGVLELLGQPDQRHSVTLLPLASRFNTVNMHPEFTDPSTHDFCIWIIRATKIVLKSKLTQQPWILSQNMFSQKKLFQQLSTPKASWKKDCGERLCIDYSS